MTIISLQQLSKTYRVPEREAGLKASVVSLFKRKYKEVKAVEQISFEIKSGEVVGFLGPNGAGKTTTLKMLSGLLHPSSGAVQVLGHTPSKREPAFLKQIALVMGNRNQLNWDIPALDSFKLNQAIFDVPAEQYDKTIKELIELMELGDLVKKPVRNLSLGERMKMEFVGALIHRPRVLFLDEPTIGLDVTMQRRLRDFVADYNKRTDATILLTSHYMADVEALCKRVIVIHHGKLLYDGDLSGLVTRFSASKTIGVTLSQPAGQSLASYGEVIAQADDKFTLRVAKSDAPKVAARLLTDLQVADLTMEDPPIEDVIAQVFAQGKESA
ncbi:MAG TPA: ATP-binding cassette domain-containing protein [Anaerolineales bacterium]|nr:ATP-binding cassette domain-containing protein [Anaerolineales bacterium]